MTERTVTEKQIRDALKNRNLNPEHMDFKRVLKDLFPQLPQVGEVVLVWDNGVKGGQGEWFPFVELDCGVVMVTDRDGDKESWDNYRRQTAIEKGEK